MVRRRVRRVARSDVRVRGSLGCLVWALILALVPSALVGLVVIALVVLSLFGVGIGILT